MSRPAPRPVVYIGWAREDNPGFAQLHTAVTSEVADLLAKAEIIVGGANLRGSGQTRPATHVLAPDMIWDDLTFAVRHTEELIANARQMKIRKRLEGVL
jgi:alpha-beta hydrolase superfamily lysophospholipase